MHAMVVPVPKVTAPLVTTALLEHRVARHEILNTILTDKGPQLVSKVFTALCNSLGTKLDTKTDYHPEPNGQVKGFHKTLIASLHQYIDYRQSSRDIII